MHLTLPELLVIERKTFRKKLAMVAACGFILFAFSGGFATYGYLRGVESGKAFERERLAYTPTRVVPAMPFTQWQCTPQETAERDNVCATRERMGKVKAGKG